jgi:hypothetical protein
MWELLSASSICFPLPIQSVEDQKVVLAYSNTKTSPNDYGCGDQI